MAEKNKNNYPQPYVPNKKRGRITFLPIGLIIFVLLLIIGLIYNLILHITAGSLNENSLCSEYTQASTAAQNAALTNMMIAHGSSASDPEVFVERISVTGFCAGYPDRPINGVYNQNP